MDPTTCERDYSMAEMEFMQAMHDYKQSSGRMFPTWSEVLEVIKALGYEKLHESAAAVVQARGEARAHGLTFFAWGCLLNFSSSYRARLA